MKAPQKQRQKKAVKSSSVIRKVSIDQQAIAQAKADDLARLNASSSTSRVEMPPEAPEIAPKAFEIQNSTNTPASTETAVQRTTDASSGSDAATPTTVGAATTQQHPADANGIAAQAEPNHEPEVQAEPPIESQPVEPQPRLPEWCRTTGDWHALAEAVVGLAHRDAKVALPCQDAALAQAAMRPLVIACDGAGSAAVSELGSQALTVGLSRLVHTLEVQFAQLLDQADSTDDDFARQMVRTLLRHAKGILQDLAAQYRREVRDFRSTVLLAVVGQKRWLWLKVGDGAVVMERIEQRYTAAATGEQLLSLHPVLCSLGEVGKGEFANQTTFVDDALSMNDVQWDVLPSEGLTGVAVMSDGAAEKLVSNDGQSVAGLTSQWFDLLRQQELRRRDLTQAFYSERFVKGSTGDDRCVALLSAQVDWPS